MFELKIIEVEKERREGRKKKNEIEETEELIEASENVAQKRTALFRKIIECAADIVDDAEIKVSDKGLSIQFMDAMNVAMMDVFLSKSTFDVFRCDRDLTLGLKIKEFLKILRAMRSDSSITFFLHCDDNPDALSISFEGETYISNYDIKLQNIGTECYDIPEINFTAEAEMMCSELLYLRKAVGNFSEYIQVSASNTAINFSQTGEIIDSNMIFKAPEAGKYNIKLNVTEDVKVEIPMKYMNCITKTANFCTHVGISLGNNAPVFFEFLIGDFGHVKYYIAPKISD